MRRRPHRRAAAYAVEVVAAGLVLTACTSSQPVVVATFPVTAAPSATIAPSGCAQLPAGSEPAARGLPAIALACLGGGADVDLARLRGPAVVNVWSSWCNPCLSELPVLARFAAAGRGSVTIVGIDYEDFGRGPAVDELTRAGVRYPNVTDPRGGIGVAGVPPLPSTFFLDAAGTVVHHEVVPYTSVAALRADVQRYLGVRTGGAPGRTEGATRLIG